MTKGLKTPLLPCTVRLYPNSNTSGNNAHIGGSSTNQISKATTANSLANRANSTNI